MDIELAFLEPPYEPFRTQSSTPIELGLLEPLYKASRNQSSTVIEHSPNGPPRVPPQALTRCPFNPAHRAR